MQPPVSAHVPHPDDAHMLENFVAVKAAAGLIPESADAKRVQRKELAKQKEEEKQGKERRLYVKVSELQRQLLVRMFLQFGDSKEPSWYWYVCLTVTILDFCSGKLGIKLYRVEQFIKQLEQGVDITLTGVIGRPRIKFGNLADDAIAEIMFISNLFLVCFE
jgi:hypothetical protein